MKLSKFGLILVLIIGFNSSTFAQRNIDTQSLVWMEYSLDFQIHKKWNITHSLSERMYWFPWRQHQMVSINKAKYDLGNGLKTAPGFTIFQINLPQDPFADEGERVWEIRPHAEISYSNNISSKWNLTNRALMEWRYFENSNGNFAFRNYRYRHLLQLIFNLNSHWRFRLYDEIMINFGKRITNNTFDQNRLGLSTKYSFNNGFGFEMGYLNWYQQQASGNDFFNRHIMTFTISKKFNFVKQSN